MGFLKWFKQLKVEFENNMHEKMYTAEKLNLFSKMKKFLFQTNRDFF